MGEGGEEGGYPSAGLASAPMGQRVKGTFGHPLHFVIPMLYHARLGTSSSSSTEGFDVDEVGEGERCGSMEDGARLSTLVVRLWCHPQKKEGERNVRGEVFPTKCVGSKRGQGGGEDC